VRHGARVLCTVGSSEKAVAAEALGAERAIRYREEDFVEVLRDVAGGADVILDNIGRCLPAAQRQGAAHRRTAWWSSACRAA
jgi:NADPH:quinone reductase-like Zn-dependent oxidoreductase